MSPRHLREHANHALLALELAEKEAAHLAYTHRTLFAQTIDVAWVERLSSREDLAEKIDAFVGRFGRLQDHLGEKLIPPFFRTARPEMLMSIVRSVREQAELLDLRCDSA